MSTQTDQQLLHNYAENRCDAAFTELVQRHLGFVHSTARRLANNEHAAEDISQGVFVLLAQNAAQLAAHPFLPGWLHTTTRNLAAKAVRTAIRQQHREQEAAYMSNLLSGENEPEWQQIAPELDTCLGELKNEEREALFLRYFQGKTAIEISGMLGISSDAAQKRVSRALEKLRELFTKRGVTISAGGLAVLLAANAVQAAPLTLLASVSAAALSAPLLATSTITAATTKGILMTTIQKIAITSTITILAGVSFYEAHKAAGLRAQNQQEQAELTQQIEQLQSERDGYARRLTEANRENDRMKALSGQKELQRLRSEVEALRKNLAGAKARATEQKPVSPEEQFNNHKNATVYAGKQMGLALQVFLNDNNHQYPTNLADLSKELGGSFDFNGISIFGFEYPAAGAQGPLAENAVVLRERLVRQAPDGTWNRIYLFADGSVQSATAYDGNFDAWEKQNTAQASVAQTQ